MCERPCARTPTATIDVQRHRDRGRDHRVVDAQQVEAGEHRAGRAAGEVGHVEQAHRLGVAGSSTLPARDRRQRRAHQHRRRRQHDEADQRAQRDRAGAGFGERQVDALDVGQRERDRDAEDRDAELRAPRRRGTDARRAGVSFGSSQLPSAIPPMNAHNSTATEMDEAPTTSWTR